MAHAKGLGVNQIPADRLYGEALLIDVRANRIHYGNNICLLGSQKELTSSQDRNLEMRAGSFMDERTVVVPSGRFVHLIPRILENKYSYKSLVSERRKMSWPWPTPVQSPPRTSRL